MTIFLAGHRGMVGAAIHRRLAAAGVTPVTRDRAELDLADPAAVRAAFAAIRPETVILAAARVGGIHANASEPASFLRDNLMIECAVIHEAFAAGARRLLFLGSSCIYPRDAPQPIPETALLTGPLEPTNAPYAIAKIAGLALCAAYSRQHGVDYRAIMPCNLYGPGDSYEGDGGHVVPSLIRRFHEAATRGDPAVTVWGTGTPRREFLHVDDLADAALHVLDLAPAAWREAVDPAAPHLNVGAGRDIAIEDLAALIADLAGFTGTIRYDPSRPDGTPRKLLDTTRLTALGWRPRIALRDGLADTCAAYARRAAA
jgi:GDP-L-fucose synthase